MTERPYHHGNLREALVEAGVAAVREGGVDALAIRDLARRVGVSHNAAYRHFADKDAVLAEVAAAGMAELTAAGARRLAAVVEEDPVLAARLRLRELGRGYVDFALREPGLFRVAFAAWPSSAAAAEVAEKLEGATVDTPFGQLNACLDELVAVGHLAPAARPGAEYTAWALVHGLSMLLLEGPLQGLDPAARSALVDHALADVDRAFGATTGAHPPLG